ncbi:MAG: hypothetical protein AAB438_02455, partial [Patescibacteria group bacterium]
MKESNVEHKKPASKEEIENTKQASRDRLAETLRESRRSRDEELTKLEKSKKKVFNFLSPKKERPEAISQEIKNKKNLTRKLLEEGKYDIDLEENLLQNERKQLFKSTVLEPITKIENIIYDYKKIDEVELISKEFSEENFRMFMSEADPKEIRSIVAAIHQILKAGKYSNPFYQKIINLSKEYFPEIEGFFNKNFHAFYNAEFINNILGDQSSTEEQLSDEKIMESIKNFEGYYKEEIMWQRRYGELNNLTNFILTKGPEDLKTWIKEQVKTEIEKENFVS